MDKKQAQQQRLDQFKANFTADEREGLEGSDYALIAVGDKFSRNELQKALNGLCKNLRNPTYIRYASRGDTEHNQARAAAIERVLARVTFQ